MSQPSQSKVLLQRGIVKSSKQTQRSAVLHVFKEIPAGDVIFTDASRALHVFLHSVNTSLAASWFFDRVGCPADNQETTMLSPHEFATLLLIKDSPDQLQLDRAELDTLLERELVTLEGLASGNNRPQLTADGDSLLQAIARMH